MSEKLVLLVLLGIVVGMLHVIALSLIHISEPTRLVR